MHAVCRIMLLVKVGKTCCCGSILTISVIKSCCSLLVTECPSFWFISEESTPLWDEEWAEGAIFCVAISSSPRHTQQFEF